MTAKSIRKICRLAIVLTAATAFSNTAQARNISIHTEFQAFGIDELLTIFGEPAIYRPRLTAGARFAPAERLALDLSGSFLYQSGVEERDSRNTDARPSLFSAGLEVGAAWFVHRSSNAQLALRPAFELLFVRQAERVFGIDGASGETKYAYYTSVVPTIFAGIEPSYSLGDHFGIYTRLGMAFTFYPRSRYVDSDDPDYDFSDDEFPMDKREDSRFGMLLDGVDVGIRYTF